jgi:rare lipoprotein A
MARDGKWILRLAPLAMVLVLASCSSHKPPRGAPPSAAVPGQTQEGMSSWYGKEFDGRPTASGERFDMNGISAAHRTLPLGTLVRVTNLDNDREVELRINDRGPFVKGRILDCSYGAAKSLGFAGAGLARVRIEVLETAKERPRRAPPPGEILVASQTPAQQVLDGTFTVQAGAFLNQANALRFRDQLAKTYGDAYVIKFRDFYRVRVGHLNTEEEADLLQERIRSSGGESFVTRND